MEWVYLGLGEWMGELRSCEDNGDFSPMKGKYVNEDYAEEAREYLRRFTEEQLLGGVKGDYICGVPIECSEELRRVLYLRAVAREIFKVYDDELLRPSLLEDSVWARRAFRREARELLSSLYDRKSEKDGEGGGIYPEWVDSTGEDGPNRFLLRTCLSVGNRWSYPEEIVREFKGRRMPVKDLVYDVLEATILARPDARDAFYLGTEFRVVSDLPGAK